MSFSDDAGLAEYARCPGWGRIAIQREQARSPLCFLNLQNSITLRGCIVFIYSLFKALPFSNVEATYLNHVRASRLLIRIIVVALNIGEHIALKLLLGLFGRYQSI